jgi:HAD superfamily hydrolase (TIGR01509 family)
MTLKAILFDFNGVILDDEPLHQELIVDLVRDQNWQPSSEDLQTFCVGRSDRAGIQDLLASRGRVVTAVELDRLLTAKAQAYQQRLSSLNPLPIFAGVQEFVQQLHQVGLKLAIVSGARQAEIALVLERIHLTDCFEVIVAAEDITRSKPEPEGYQLGIQALNQKYPDLELTPGCCLAIEDSIAGIQAARQAQIPVVGVAHTFPFHLLQRQADWVVDCLDELEFDRIVAAFGKQDEF